MLFTGLTLGTHFRYEILKKYQGKVRMWVLRTQDCRSGINDPNLFPFAYTGHEEEIINMFTECDTICGRDLWKLLRRAKRAEASRKRQTTCAAIGSRRWKRCSVAYRR